MTVKLHGFLPLFLGILLLGMIVGQFIPISSATATDPNSSNQLAKSFAETRGISEAEAAKRLGWQERAHLLDETLRGRKPDSFGGIWIGENDDRVKVGSVANSIVRQDIDSMLSSLDLADAVDIVKTKYSIAELETALGEVTRSIALTDSSTDIPFQVGLRTDLNRVIVKVPQEQAKTSKEQENLLAYLQATYGDLIDTEPIQGEIIAASCNDDFCDSPLRTGVKLRGSNDGYASIYCSAGFGVMGDSGSKYILTSGHCLEIGPGFASMEDVFFPGIKKIGPAHNTSSNLNMWSNNGIDGLVIDIKDEYGWDAKGWVYVREGEGVSPFLDGPSRNEVYDVSGSTTSGQFVNERVCNSGARTGSSCGPVKEAGVSVVYDGRRSYSLVRAGLCMLQGDSGGPVFRNGVALGLNSAYQASTGETCDYQKYYTGINAIIQEMGNTIHVY